jgi:hypothetical protein
MRWIDEEREEHLRDRSKEPPQSEDSFVRVLREQMREQRESDERFHAKMIRSVRVAVVAVGVSIALSLLSLLWPHK